ncbi:MAG: sugar phosphate isomerase/epimerase [Provencibacterium sp.]|jgi:sugar phosphate isomerase/epimerase|nr:sugar phosphate isomerase/epimerase [Provencibacterium sp.]
MKIALSTYSLSRRMQEGTLTQLGCIQKAKEMGFDAIEFVGILPHDGSSVEEYAARLREECERVGMPVSNYTTGADFLRCESLEKEIERVKHEVDIAALLGAVSMRHDATVGYPEGTRGFRGFSDCLPVLSDACRQVTQYAKQKNVRTMVENHGFFCQDSERVEALVNAVHDDNFGLLCDMGNFLCADEDPAAAFSRVAPYAFYAHAKDFHIKSAMGPNPGSGFFRTRGGNYLRGAVIGHGEVPVLQCLQILKNAGYSGNFAIEFEGIEEPECGISIGLENLRRFVSEVFEE